MSPTQRSKQTSSTSPPTVPVVVDLWAPWCGPCLTLGPILEKVVDATEGKVVLTKVNIDENPQISPYVPGPVDPGGRCATDRIVDGFLGAVPERDVEGFVQGLLPTEEQTTVASLVAAGDEASLRQAIELEPGNEDAVVALPSCSSSSSSSTRPSPCSSASPSPIAPARSRRRRLGAPASRPPTTTTPADRPAGTGQGRRRGPPAVRRHPRADGTGRPADGGVPQAPEPRTVLNGRLTPPTSPD